MASSAARRSSPGIFVRGGWALLNAANRACSARSRGFPAVGFEVLWCLALGTGDARAAWARGLSLRSEGSGMGFPWGTAYVRFNRAHLSFFDSIRVAINFHHFNAMAQSVHQGGKAC